MRWAAVLVLPCLASCAVPLGPAAPLDRFRTAGGDEVLIWRDQIALYPAMAEADGEDQRRRLSALGAAYAGSCSVLDAAFIQDVVYIGALGCPPPAAGGGLTNPP